jgi:hypothetical protein
MNIISLATKAGQAVLCIMAQQSQTHKDHTGKLDHKQPPTPIQMDNAMMDAVIMGKLQPKQTKAMDVRLHWLQDRECQQQFWIYWLTGKMNYADYWTNHYTELHHWKICKELPMPQIVLLTLLIEQHYHTALMA